MTSYENAVKRIQENMLKQTTVDQARFSLRQCGVLNENYQVVDVYREIIVKKVTVQKKHEHK